MHELSIAQNLVEVATENAHRVGASRVLAVRIRIGALAGVVVESLQFCYELAVRDTLLEGSRLEVEEQPVVIWCSQCQAEAPLASVQSFRCFRCQSPASEVRRGRELELIALEIEGAPSEESS